MLNTIYVDFDGTIAQTPKKCCQMLNKQYNKFIHYLDIQKYNFTDKFPEITSEFMDEMFCSDEFFNGLEVFPNSLKSLFKLSKLFKIIIATKGLSENLTKKEQWCKNNMPFDFEFVGFECGPMNGNQDKSSLDMSNGIFIDDHIDCLRSSNAPVKILYFSHPGGEWQRISIRDNVLASDSWSKIYKYIKENYV